MKHKIILTILFILIPGHYAYALEFMDFGPYSGKVVDADTKEPVEGAVVIVSWNRHFGGGSAFMNAQEVTTDKKGEFYLNGILVLNPWTRLISEAGLSIYKSEYHSIGIGPWKKWKELDSAIVFKNILKIEDGVPIFFLKRRSAEERSQSLPYDPAASVPPEKKNLLLREKEKAYQFLYPTRDKNE